MKDILDKAARIRLVIFDVDGVLTDGSLFVGDDGQEYKAFNSRDGHGIKMLIKHGVTVAIITGRTSKVVEHRMENLGIEHVYQGKLEKLPAYEELAGELGVAGGKPCVQLRGSRGASLLDGLTTAIGGDTANFEVDHRI